MTVRFRVAWEPFRAGETVSHLSAGTVRGLAVDGVVDIVPDQEPEPVIETRAMARPVVDKMARTKIRPLQQR